VAGAAGGSLFYQTTTLTGIFLFLLFFFSILGAEGKSRLVE